MLVGANDLLLREIDVFDINSYFITNHLKVATGYSLLSFSKFTTEIHSFIFNFTNYRQIDKSDVRVVEKAIKLSETYKKTSISIFGFSGYFQLLRTNVLNINSRL